VNRVTDGSPTCSASYGGTPAVSPVEVADHVVLVATSAVRRIALSDPASEI